MMPAAKGPATRTSYFLEETLTIRTNFVKARNLIGGLRNLPFFSLQELP
jgi:hypothetical protein